MLAGTCIRSLDVSFRILMVQVVLLSRYGELCDGLCVGPARTIIAIASTTVSKMLPTRARHGSWLSDSVMPRSISHACDVDTPRSPGPGGAGTHSRTPRVRSATRGRCSCCPALSCCLGQRLYKVQAQPGVYFWARARCPRQPARESGWPRQSCQWLSWVPRACWNSAPACLAGHHGGYGDDGDDDKR